MTRRRSLGGSVWLAVRSLAWTVLLPGMVAGYLPWRYFGMNQVRLDLLRPTHLLAATLIIFGAVLLTLCIWEFAHSGRGTLAPVDPPRELVVRGLYRYVRNPMYLSVTAIVLGETLFTQSRALFAYWIVWFIAANVFVLGYEEPTLRRRFGSSYERYTQEVGRWLPRIRPRSPD